MRGIFELPVEFSGLSATDKIQSLRSSMKQSGANLLIISALDEIAWTFNIRGNDVECNPVAIAYSVITDKQSILFTDAVKISRELHDYLDSQNIITAEYSKISDYLNSLKPETTILFDGNKVNYNLRKAIPADCRVIEAPSPVALLKSIKNEIEIEGFRNVMIKDGVALVRFMMWA